MRPKMKSTRNEILFHHEKNSVYITCHCGQNEIKIYFRVGRSQTTHQKIKTNHKWEILDMARFWIWVLERAWPYLCFVNFVKLYRNFICIIGSASELLTTPTHQSSRKSETSASFHDCRLQHYQEKT